MRQSLFFRQKGLECRLFAFSSLSSRLSIVSHGFKVVGGAPLFENSHVRLGEAIADSKQVAFTLGNMPKEWLWLLFGWLLSRRASNTSSAAMTSSRFARAVLHLASQGVGDRKKGPAKAAQAHRVRGAFEAAEVAIREGQRLNPDDPDMAAEAAEIKMARAQWTDAINAWRTAISLYEKKPPATAYRQLSKAYRKTGAFDQAEASVRIGQSSYPNDRGLMLEAAEIATACGDWKNSIQLWEQACSALQTAQSFWRYD